MKKIEFKISGGYHKDGSEIRLKEELLKISDIKKVSYNSKDGRLKIILYKDLDDNLKEEIIEKLYNIGFYNKFF